MVENVVVVAVEEVVVVRSCKEVMGCSRVDVDVDDGGDDAKYR